MQTKDFLNAAMKATGCKTDYQLAKALEIPTQRISDFRDGKRRADEYTCTRIAIALGVDPITVIAEVAVEWEKNETKRKWWRDFLASATKPSALVTIVALVCLMTLQNVSIAGNDRVSDKNVLQNKSLCAVTHLPIAVAYVRKMHCNVAFISAYVFDDSPLPSARID